MNHNKAVLITGVAGFIGFHVAREFISAGIQIIGVDNLNPYYDVSLKYDRLKKLGLSESITNEFFQFESDRFMFFKGDLADREFVNFIFEKNIGSIIHLAAQAGVRYSLENPEAYMSSNITGFFHILEVARSKGIKNITYASSSSVYGNSLDQPFDEEMKCDRPISLYAATKKSNELMAHSYYHLFDMSLYGLRFFTVYGPWGRPDMAPILFAKAAFEGHPINVFNNGDQQRDFTFIDDIVRGVIAAHEHNLSNQKANYEILNIGNGSPVKLMNFISAVEVESGVILEKNFLPAQPGDVSVTYADTRRLEELTSVRPSITLKEGVKRFISWYRSYYEV